MWYFMLRNRASGPEVVYFWGLNGRKTHQKRWEAAPPLFPMGFPEGGVQTLIIDGFRPEALLRNQNFKFWFFYPTATSDRNLK